MPLHLAARCPGQRVLAYEGHMMRLDLMLQDHLPIDRPTQFVEVDGPSIRDLDDDAHPLRTLVLDRHHGADMVSEQRVAG